MAEQKFPVKLVRASDGAKREAGNAATLNQLVWDGFQPEGEAKKAASDAKKAAPRARAAKATSTSARGQAATSGDSAEGEKTVGTNPS